MDRIIALNRSDSEPTHDETSEKIIEELNQHYSRALQAKQIGEHETAIEIFRRILQDEEVERVTHKSSGHEKFALKYCCYKNLAEIYASRASHQIALDWFLKAYTMDSTDIFFMYKFGRIASQEQNIHLANVVFQRCLELNSDHIPSFDGILALLCNQEDYFEAYGWAIYCHKKFPKYQRAIDVILDVHNMLKDSPLLQNAFTPIFTDAIGIRSSKPSLFPPASYYEIQNHDAEPEFTEFNVTAPSFLAFGHIIKSIYVKSTQVTSYLTTKLSLSDICDINNIDLSYDATKENLSKPTVQVFPESSACNDPISHRSSIQAIFQEILPQYFSWDIDEDIDIQPPSLIRAICQPNHLDNVITSTTNDETFHISSLTYLRQFIDTLKAEPFHLLGIVFEWLKWLSKCSHIQLPIELQSLYIDIFEYQSNHIDWNMWDGLPHTRTFDLFVMAVFYIELKIVSNVRNDAGGLERLFDDHLIQSFHHILFTRNLFIVNCDPIVEARLNLLHFQFAIDTNDMELGSDLLNQINACFTNNINPIEIIRLPNQIYCTFVDPWIIANEMKLMECLLQQTTIQRDYSNGFERLDNVESVLLKHRQYNFESKQLSIFQQFEMLLEIFWLTDRFDVCLHWCEIGLNESMRIRREHKAKNLPISKEFACHVQFLTIYLQELLQRNHQVIDSLDGKRERLVRSMAHLLEAQYDQTLVEHRITLFAGNAFIECLHAILKSDQHLNAMESQWAALNIITKVAEWLIMNNIPLPVDDQFLICAWRTLNLYSCNSSGLKFHSTEIIRLLSHSIFGYPNEIEQHQNVCTCKRIPIDWNGAALLFTSFDDISNGMSDVERKSLIDDLLNTIPDNVQTILHDAIEQLMNFINDKIDFPHKYIPVKSFSSNLKDIFHHSANIGDMNVMNYGPYSREQLFEMDLVINPQRFSSWMALLTTKINQFDTLFNANDLTKINFDDVEILKNAIDTCFDKCHVINRAEKLSNVDYLWCYGLYAYKLCNFFTKGTAMRAEFNGVYTPKRPTFNWKTAKQILISFATADSTTAIEPMQTFQCYFVLGKIAEKQNPAAIRDILENYLLAEQQLFDCEDDDTLLSAKIEINFRITASIYKYVRRVENAVLDEPVLTLLWQVLKRDKGRIFSDSQLASRPNYAEAIDENANKVDVPNQSPQQVNVIIKMCADDFEWYLELCPAYYKAAFYLIKINLARDDQKCRSLLLQVPRKAVDQEKKLSLFDIHRNRHLFKVKGPLQLDTIHDLTSFNKYMEKCVRILIEYLSTNRNPHLQLVLALQWSKLAEKNTAVIHVNQQQKDRLIETILEQFVRTASNYVNQSNPTTAKTKTFGEFFMNLYELYTTCEIHIKTAHFSVYSQMMIACYRRCMDGHSNDSTPDELNDFQMALDYCAKKLSEKTQAQSDKAAKKLNK